VLVVRHRSGCRPHWCSCSTCWPFTPHRPRLRATSTNETQDPQPPEFHIVASLSTDDPHWRRTTILSVLLATAAGGGARRTHGPARLILALAAAALLLPSISLASMIALGLLLKRLGRERSQDA
jgi:hypothetical protein